MEGRLPRTDGDAPYQFPEAQALLWIKGSLATVARVRGDSRPRLAWITDIIHAKDPT